MTIIQTTALKTIAEQRAILNKLEVKLNSCRNNTQYNELKKMEMTASKTMLQAARSLVSSLENSIELEEMLLQTKKA